MRGTSQAIGAMVAALLVLVGTRPGVAAQEGETWLGPALAAQASTRAHLRVLGDAFECVDARFISYRRSDRERDIADQWYVASQTWADMLLLRHLTPASWEADETRCHVEKSMVFLDRLWDYAASGYYPRADPTGMDVWPGPRYADDNALGGLLFLEAASQEPADSARRRQYLHAARREMAFLLESGLWDDTFGGGFWWNTNRGDTLEGKPAQTNALVALFFGRMAEATGDPLARVWALRTLLWLDTILWDESRSLYRYSVAYAEPEQRAGPPSVTQRFFNYDQAIAIEAQLVAERLDGDPVRYPRARAVGEAMHAAFWGQERGGYNLEVGIEQVFTSYAAWSSIGHLALYEADRDERWRTYAIQNWDALASTVRQPDGGVALRHYRCVDRIAPGCEDGTRRWVVDETRDGAAQAWWQYLAVRLAEGERLAAQGSSGTPVSAR